MGWDYTQGFTKDDMIARCVRTRTWRIHCDSVGYSRTVKYSVRGNVLWCVKEVGTESASEMQVTNRYIACYLLRAQRGYGYGYKDMDEGMHPYYYNCPLSYLKLATPTCEAWRERVRMYHQRQRDRRKLTWILARIA